MELNRPLPPETRTIVDELRAQSRRLQNGNEGDLALIGRAVSNMGFLMAHIIEARHPTAAECSERHEQFEKRLVGDVERHIDQRLKGRGINVPTAVTVISVAGMVFGLVWQLFGQ